MSKFVMFYIYGDPITKKNSQSMAVNRSTGKMFPVQSKAYKSYEKSALAQIEEMQVGGPYWGDSPCNLKATYYMKTHRRVDLCNLLAATCDILVKAGVIADDNCNIVKSHDGSRVCYDSANPRVEIMLEEAAE